MTTFEKLALQGFNPLTVLELKKRFENGQYNKTYTDINTGEELQVPDQYIESILSQIYRICDIDNIS